MSFLDLGLQDFIPLILIIAVIAFFVISRKKQIRKNVADRNINTAYDQEQFDLVDQLVKKHAAVLSRKLDEANQKNDYGIVISGNQEPIWEEFIDTVCKSVDLTYGEIKFRAEEVLDNVSDQIVEKRFDPNSYPENGHEFEKWVAHGLNQFGWSTRVTQESNDQGIDIIASKNGLKVGIQCKRYEAPVSNDAVQEVYTGKSYYGVEHAIVISNSTYTQSAKNLARANNVFLLSTYDIPNMDSLIN